MVVYLLPLYNSKLLSTEPSVSCSKKLIVTLELSNNKKYATEQLDFDVSCVDSPTGECPCPCNYSSDPKCTCRNLAQKLSVGVTKSAVYATYPMNYIKKFNGRPNEAIVQTDTCVDGELAEDATCGWAHDGDTGDNIPGFGFTKLPTAHCLRLDEWWWYLGYQLGAYQLDFDITLNLTTTTTAAATPATSNSSLGASTLPAPSSLLSPSSSASSPAAASPPSPVAAGSNGTQEELLVLSPSQPFVLNSGRTLSAKLLGDLEGYVQIPQLMDKYVLVPSPPGKAVGAVLSEHKSDWLVMDESMLTLDGTACNKIGVGYSAFCNQPNRCDVAAGTCLASQIVNLVADDQDRLAKGLTPRYLITKYGTGDDNPRQVVWSNRGNLTQFSLNLPLTSIKTSLVQLTVKADDLTFTTNRSPAKILKSQVCTLSGSICGSFQALAGKGYLKADIQNTGSLVADYTISVLDCPLGILPVAAQSASIASAEIKTFTFVLQAETDRPLKNASCQVAVADAVGELVDSSVITFTTNATEYGKDPIQSNVTDNWHGGGSPGNSTGCTACPNMLNVVCAAKNGCWGKLGGSLVLFTAVPIALLALWVAFRRGWLTAFINWLFTAVEWLFLQLGTKQEPKRQRSGTEEKGGGKSGGLSEGRGSELEPDAVVAVAGKGRRSGKRGIWVDDSASAGPAVKSGSTIAATILKPKKKATPEFYAFSLDNPLAAEGSESTEGAVIEMPTRVHLSETYHAPQQQLYSAPGTQGRHQIPGNPGAQVGSPPGASLQLRPLPWGVGSIDGPGSCYPESDPGSPLVQPWPPGQWFLPASPGPSSPLVPPFATATWHGPAPPSRLSSPASAASQDMLLPQHLSGVTPGSNACGMQPGEPLDSLHNATVDEGVMPGATGQAALPPCPPDVVAQQAQQPQQEGQQGQQPQRTQQEDQQPQRAQQPAFPRGLETAPQRPAEEGGGGSRLAGLSAAEERLQEWLQRHPALLPRRDSGGSASNPVRQLWSLQYPGEGHNATTPRR
ncbi:hypothetical protein N2152v2_005062 [Parachlorella kessleri]